MTIKLGAGTGSINTTACWMSLVGWLSGETAWGDEAPCVDRAIRNLCIYVNDSLLTDEDRERVIGPHVYAVMGTRADDLETSARRRELLIEALDGYEYPHDYASSARMGELIVAAAVSRELRKCWPGGVHMAIRATVCEDVIMPLILKLCAVGARTEVDVGDRTVVELEGMQR